MEINQFILILNSGQPENLIAFYKDVVGLTPNLDFDEPGVFMAGTTMFIVEGHSEVKGQTKEPQRVLLNFTADDALSEQRRLEEHGVRFIRSATNEPGFGIFATFLDPDGNYCQLVQFDRRISDSA